MSEQDDCKKVLEAFNNYILITCIDKEKKCSVEGFKCDETNFFNNINLNGRDINIYHIYDSNPIHAQLKRPKVIGTQVIKKQT